MTAAAAADRVRWFLLPLGLCALIAVGVHASADVLADRVLWIVDAVGGFFDAIFSRWSVTAPLVEMVGLEQRTFIARGTALLWELSADVLLALPALGYEGRSGEGELSLARELFNKTFRKPTPIRIVRPLCTAAVSIAGACSVARLVRSTLLFFPALANVCALVTLVLAIVLLVFRATVRAMEHADEVSEAKKRQATLGLFTAIVIVPLAVAAVAGASPLLSFFR